MIEGDLKQIEIAKQIKVSEKTICEWKKKKEFMDTYDELLRSSIRTVASKAFKTQSKLLDSRSDMVKYMVSKDILDRAGYKPNDKLNVEMTLPVVISGDDDLED